MSIVREAKGGITWVDTMQALSLSYPLQSYLWVSLSQECVSLQPEQLNDANRESNTPTTSKHHEATFLSSIQYAAFSIVSSSEQVVSWVDETLILLYELSLELVRSSYLLHTLDRIHLRVEWLRLFWE